MMSSDHCSVIISFQVFGSFEYINFNVYSNNIAPTEVIPKTTSLLLLWQQHTLPIIIVLLIAENDHKHSTVLNIELFNLAVADWILIGQHGMNFHFSSSTN